jgi:tetratricopeptide (TPR) repeat protein
VSRGNEEVLREIQRRLQRGDLDGAAAGYETLVEANPDDWTSINALGDLYIRLGDVDPGVEQITRAADHFFTEGFLPKAAALYRKVLKVRPDEHALQTLAEIATQLKLLVEAKQCLVQLEQQRRSRGDAAGADDCLARLDALGALSRESRAPSLPGAREVPAAPAEGQAAIVSRQSPAAGPVLELDQNQGAAIAPEMDAEEDQLPPDPGASVAAGSAAGPSKPPPSLQSVFDRLRDSADRTDELKSTRERLDEAQAEGEDE